MSTPPSAAFGPAPTPAFSSSPPAEPFLPADREPAGNGQPPAASLRTRNGLVKRVRSADRTPAGTRVSHPTAGHPPARPAERPDQRGPERSPEEIRQMLSAFRGGHERGESRAHQPASGQTGSDQTGNHQHRNGPGGPA